MGALIAGVAAGSAIGGGLSYLGATEQSKAAEKAAKAQRAAGQRGYDHIEASLAGSEEALNVGNNAANEQLRRMEALLAGGQGQLTNTFAQERALGSDAMARLLALSSGDMSGFQASPGYQFRMDEGNKAIERAAAAAGSFGSGGNLKDFARFSQGLASQEYGDHFNRLMGLAGIGTAANRTYAGLSQGLLGAQAGAIGNQANLLSGHGQSISSLRQMNAANRANALTGNQSAVNNFNLAAADARAQGYAGVGNSINQGIGNLALLYSLSQQKPEVFTV